MIQFLSNFNLIFNFNPKLIQFQSKFRFLIQNWSNFPFWTRNLYNFNQNFHFIFNFNPKLIEFQWKFRFLTQNWSKFRWKFRLLLEIYSISTITDAILIHFQRKFRFQREIDWHFVINGSDWIELGCLNVERLEGRRENPSTKLWKMIISIIWLRIKVGCKWKRKEAINLPAGNSGGKNHARRQLQISHRSTDRSIHFDW